MTAFSLHIFDTFFVITQKPLTHIHAIKLSWNAKVFFLVIYQLHEEIEVEKRSRLLSQWEQTEKERFGRQYPVGCFAWFVPLLLQKETSLLQPRSITVEL